MSPRYGTTDPRETSTGRRPARRQEITLFVDFAEGQFGGVRSSAFRRLASRQKAELRTYRTAIQDSFEYLHQPLGIRRCMSAAERYPQSRGTGRNRRRPDGGHEEALPLELSGDLHRPVGGLEQDGDDRTDSILNRYNPCLAKLLPKFAGKLQKVLPALRLGFDNFDRRTGGGTDRRGQRGRIDLRAGPIPEPVDERCWTGDEPPQRAHRLAQRPDPHGDALLDTQKLGHAAPPLAEHARAVGFINDQ